MRASFLPPAFDYESFGEVDFVLSVLRIQLKRALEVFQGTIKILPVMPRPTEIKFGFGKSRLVCNREFVLGDRFLDAARFMQAPSVIELRLRIARKDLRDLGRALESRHDSAAKLRGTKGADRNH